MTPDKDLRQLQKHIMDLASKAYQQNMFTFSDFLGLGEQDIYHQIEREVAYAKPALYGGMDRADRVMLRFGSSEELGYEMDFPIVCIHIEPLQAKFADKLSHRDFLGALMNLGIDRSKLGDIKTGESEAYLFCREELADFVCENLSQVKHTHVKCSVGDYVETEAEKPKEKLVMVASLRADAVISKVYNVSRGDCILLFQTGKVFLNGRLLEGNAKTVREEDVINVRGFGKFVVKRQGGQTRSGKLCLNVEVYS